jgi:hypothetical protein
VVDVVRAVVEVRGCVVHVKVVVVTAPEVVMTVDVETDVVKTVDEGVVSEVV